MTNISVAPRTGALRSPRLRLLLGIIILLLFLVVAIEITVQFIIRPQLRIRRIVIEGDMPLTQAELVEIAAVESGMRYQRIDTEMISDALRAHPSIRNALVRKRLPDTLHIDVEARVPLAIGFASINGSQQPIVFDEEGIVFQIGDQIEDWQLPIISGLRLENVRLGVRLPQLLHGLLRDFRSLKVNSPLVYEQISEMRIVSEGTSDFEIVVYPVNYSVPVRIGSYIDEQIGTYMLVTLDVLAQQGRLAAVNEIDLRSGEAIYRFQER